MMFRRFALVLMLTGVFGFAFMTSSRAAGAPADLNVSLTFGSCAGSILEGSYTVAVVDADGVVLNATTPLELRRVYSVAGVVEEFVSPLLSTDSAQIIIDFGTTQLFNISLTISLVSDPSISQTYIFDCVNGVVSAIQLDDDRINRGQGDLIAALYVRADSQRRPVIRVYSIDATSRGVYAGDYTLADVEPYLNNPPSRNTLIRRIDDTALYALTTGEFQINIGPDIEGKTTALIFRGFPPTRLSSYTFYLYR